MSDDEMIEESAPPDNATGLATAMLAITGLMLVIAIFTMWSLLKNHYGEGPLA